MRHGTHTGHALMPLVLLTASGAGQPGCPMYNKSILLLPQSRQTVQLPIHVLTWLLLPSCL